MRRIALVTAMAASPLTAAGGCATDFAEARTPSGSYCTDMPVILNGQADPEKPFHRLKPISTPLRSLTAPERLEALRVEACKIGADAVINAGDEESQTPDHTVVTRASGYAIRWSTIATHGASLHQAVGVTPPLHTSPLPGSVAPPPAAPPPAQ